jgi:hypothetical protein
MLNKEIKKSETAALIAKTLEGLFQSGNLYLTKK